MITNERTCGSRIGKHPSSYVIPPLNADTMPVVRVDGRIYVVWFVFGCQRATDFLLIGTPHFDLSRIPSLVVGMLTALSATSTFMTLHRLAMVL